MEDVLLDEARLDSVETLLSDILGKVESAAPAPLRALEGAIKLEESMADLHAHVALEFKQESTRSLFQAMMAADKEHIGALRKMLVTLQSAGPIPG